MRLPCYWKQEPTGLGMVRVHSKVILVDPFGKHPVIMTGSHNLGPKASAMNDDNLVIVENDPDAAAHYAVNIITIYNQYRWRFQQLQAAKNHQSLNKFNGLQAPWTSQASYFVGDKAKELSFWL
jgi:phosphatidylserine/phosphatidylglycerophosphate/cardiolipin synthase-like enzyme